jgi:LSD1 subclass zinc finger protein
MCDIEKREVHCCACSRLVMLPDGATEGNVIECPFCHTKMQIRTMTVYVAQAVEQA